MNAVLKRIGRQEAEPPWGFFIAFNTVAMAFVSLTFIGTLISYSLFDEGPFFLPVGWAAGCLLTILYINISRRNDREHLRLEARNSRLLIVLLFGIGMAITFDVAALLINGLFLPAPELLNLVPVRDNPAAWLVAILLMVLLQPVAEQLLFSGVFFPAAQQAMGAWGGYLLTVIVFGLFHMLVYAYPPVLGMWSSLTAPVLAGFVIIGARANSGSTRAAIVAHMAFGLFAVLKFFVLPA